VVRVAQIQILLAEGLVLGERMVGERSAGEHETDGESERRAKHGRTFGEPSAQVNPVRAGPRSKRLAVRHPGAHEMRTRRAHAAHTRGTHHDPTADPFASAPPIRYTPAPTFRGTTPTHVSLPDLQRGSARA